MKVRYFAGFTVGVLLLAGCGGTGDAPSAEPSDATATTPTSTTTAQADDGDASAAGDVDCSVFSKDQIATWAIWTQLFAQVRTVDALQTLSTLGYTPEDMAAILDDLDQLKGHEGEVYGTPDEALVLFRTANDNYAAVIADGDSATDADLAPLNDLAADPAAWISAQASVTDALHQACPEIS